MTQTQNVCNEINWLLDLKIWLIIESLRDGVLEDRKKKIEYLIGVIDRKVEQLQRL